MATTSPDNLWSPDPGNAYNLTIDLAAMQASNQTAFNNVNAKVADTGWTGVTLAAGWTGAIAFRRVGSLVMVRGYLAKSAGVIVVDDTPLAGVVPTQFRPANTAGAVLASGSGGQAVGARLDTAGLLRLSPVVSTTSSVIPSFTYGI